MSCRPCSSFSSIRRFATSVARSSRARPSALSASRISWSRILSALASTTAAPASCAVPRNKVISFVKTDIPKPSGGGGEVITQFVGGADRILRQHPNLDDNRLQRGLARQLAEHLVIVPTAHGGDAEVRQRHQFLGLEKEDVESRLVLLFVDRPHQGRHDDLF